MHKLFMHLTALVKTCCSIHWPHTCLLLCRRTLFAVSLGVRPWNPKGLPWRMSAVPLQLQVLMGMRRSCLHRMLCSIPETSLLFCRPQQQSFCDIYLRKIHIVQSAFRHFRWKFSLLGTEMRHKIINTFWLFQSIFSSSLIRNHEKKRGLKKYVSTGSFLTFFLL